MRPRGAYSCCDDAPDELVALPEAVKGALAAKKIGGKRFRTLPSGKFSAPILE